MMLIIDKLCEIEHKNIITIDNNKDCLKILLDDSNIDILCIHVTEDNKESIKYLMDDIFEYKIYPQSIFIYGDSDVKYSLAYYIKSKRYDGIINVDIDIEVFQNIKYKGELIEYLKAYKLRCILHNKKYISILNKIHTNNINEEIRIYKMNSRVIFRRKLSYKKAIMENSIYYNGSSAKTKHTTIVTKLINDGFIPLGGIR